MKQYLIADFSKRVSEDKGLTRFFENPANACYGREPILAKMKNGTLVCMFTAGGPTEPHSDNVILLKKSYDDGATWTATEVLFTHPYCGVWGTEIFTGWEYPMMVVSLYDGKCPFKRLQTFFSYSYDNGETWTTPSMVSGACANVSLRQGITLSSGETFFPAYYTLAENSFLWDEGQYYQKGWWDGTHHESTAVLSADGGKTFTRYGEIKDGTNSLWEPAAVELEPGHIVLCIRQDRVGRLGFCESFDMGRSFGAYRLTDIPNAGSKIAVCKIEDTVCLMGNFDAKERTHLQIWTTKDFQTFQRKIPLADDGAMFCYPHPVVDTENRKLYVVYENYKQHYLKIFSFDEILGRA